MAVEVERDTIECYHRPPEKCVVLNAKNGFLLGHLQLEKTYMWEG